MDPLLGRLRPLDTTLMTRRRYPNEPLVLRRLADANAAVRPRVSWRPRPRPDGPRDHRRPERLPPPGRVVRDARHRHLAHAARDRADEGAGRRVPPPRRARRLDAARHPGPRGRRPVHGDSGRFFATAACDAAPGATRSSTSFEPRAEDWYVEKSRLSAFFQTNLELVLRGLDAETVLLTGVLTNQCVGATTQGRDVPRLQADRRRGVHRDDAAAPARAGDRDDRRRLGPGEHARADARRAARRSRPYAQLAA